MLNPCSLSSNIQQTIIGCICKAPLRAFATCGGAAPKRLPFGMAHWLDGATQNLPVKCSSGSSFRGLCVNSQRKWHSFGAHMRGAYARVCCLLGLLYFGQMLIATPSSSDLLGGVLGPTYPLLFFTAASVSMKASIRILVSTSEKVRQSAMSLCMYSVQIFTYLEMTFVSWI